MVFQLNLPNIRFIIMESLRRLVLPGRIQSTREAAGVPPEFRQDAHHDLHQRHLRGPQHPHRLRRRSGRPDQRGPREILQDHHHHQQQGSFIQGRKCHGATSTRTASGLHYLRQGLLCFQARGEHGRLFSSPRRRPGSPHCSPPLLPVRTPQTTTPPRV